MKINNILLTSDATGGSPPLADDTNLMEGYEPGTPLVDPGSYPMKIVRTEVSLKDGVPNAAHTIKITLSNTEVVRSIKGDILQPGEATVFTQVNTVPTGKSTPKFVKDGVAYILQAATVPGLHSVQTFQQNHGLLVGVTVYVKLETMPARTNPTTGQRYEASTGVAKWWKRGEMPS